MAIVRGITWSIEVGVKPDPNYFNGFSGKESFLLFADTHDKAVAILKQYQPNINTDNIIKSERHGLPIIVELPDYKENERG